MSTVVLALDNVKVVAHVVRGQEKAIAQKREEIRNLYNLYAPILEEKGEDVTAGNLVGVMFAPIVTGARNTPPDPSCVEVLLNLGIPMNEKNKPDGKALNRVKATHTSALRTALGPNHLDLLPKKEKGEKDEAPLATSVRDIVKRILGKNPPPLTQAVMTEEKEALQEVAGAFETRWEGIAKAEQAHREKARAALQQALFLARQAGAASEVLQSMEDALKAC